MLTALVRPYLPLRRVAAVAACQAGAALSTLALPALNADLLDHGVLRGDTGHIVRAGWWMLAVAAFGALASGGALWAGARAAAEAGGGIRAAVFGRIQEFSAREFAAFGTPSLITRTTNDVQQVQMVVLLALTTMLTAPLMWVGGGALALAQDSRLAVVPLVALPLMIGLFALIIRLMRPLARLTQERIDTVTRVLREQIAGVRVVRAFVRGDHERRRFAAVSADLRETGVRFGTLVAVMFPLALLVTNLATVVVLWYGGHLVAGGAMGAGRLSAFVAYLMYVLGSTMLAGFMFMMVPRAEAGAERIREVLDTEPEVRAPAVPVTRTAAPGRLELRGVEFRHPGAEMPVLRGVTLTAGPGEVVAVVGPTGGGKSTLAGLVPRLCDVTGGTVLVEGVDVRRLDPALLARTVGLVPQRAYLFGGTVGGNLRQARPDATDAELWHALEIAQARAFVTGLDMPITQGGGNVSGGQRQRLAIARALVGRPRIYVFDDAFSALDPATDAALRRALTAETAGAAVVLISQRVPSVRDADRIVVLDGGRITESGTHGELMAHGGTYRELVLSQLTESEAA